VLLFSFLSLPAIHIFPTYQDPHSIALCGNRPDDSLSRPRPSLPKPFKSCSPLAAETAASVSALFLVRSQLKSVYNVAQTTEHGSLVGEITVPRTNWHTSADCSRVQSPGNAACLAGSEEGRRTGQRMGHRGTCTHPRRRVQAQELRTADSNCWRHGDEPRARNAMPCSGETRLNTSS